MKTGFLAILALAVMAVLGSANTVTLTTDNFESSIEGACGSASRGGAARGERSAPRQGATLQHDCASLPSRQLAVCGW